MAELQPILPIDTTPPNNQHPHELEVRLESMNLEGKGEKKPLTLLDIPLDIFTHLFTILDDESALCLGLTSNKLYPVLKMVRPEALTFVPKDPYKTRPTERSSLYIETIHNFVGPQYRRKHTNDNTTKWRPLINIAVYGSTTSPSSSEEYLWQQRWIDYWHLKSAATDLNLKVPVPSPFNMGDGWYDLMFNLLGVVEDQYVKQGHKSEGHKDQCNSHSTTPSV